MLQEFLGTLLPTVGVIGCYGNKIRIDYLLKHIRSLRGILTVEADAYSWLHFVCAYYNGCSKLFGTLVPTVSYWLLQLTR